MNSSRPRFSLLSMLLIVTLVALSLSHSHTSWRLHQLESELGNGSDLLISYGSNLFDLREWDYKVAGDNETETTDPTEAKVLAYLRANAPTKTPAHGLIVWLEPMPLTQQNNVLHGSSGGQSTLHNESRPGTP